MFGQALDLVSHWPSTGAMERYRELSEQLVATEALPILRAHFDWQVGARLRDAGDDAATREFLHERAKLYTPPNDALANIIRMEANIVRSQGDWTTAELLIERARAALTPIDEKTGAYTFQAYAAWHDLRFTLFNEMGMLDAAAEALAQQGDFATRSKDPIAIVNAFMNRATLALSQEDWDALDEMIADVDSGRVVIDARERARLEFRSAACLAEAEREGRRPLGRSESLLRALVDGEGTPDDVALEARTNLAMRLFDLGRNAESSVELAQAEARIERLGRGSAITRSCELPLAALRARLVLARTDGTVTADELREQRMRLRSLFEDQLERWRRAPAEASGIGYLHFGDSYLLANELMRIELALARVTESARHESAQPGSALPDSAQPGSDRSDASGGARIALEIPLALHSVGTLVRGTPARELDLAGVERTLVKPERGFLLYFPGRAHSLVFALDSSGVHAWELDSWLTLELARRELQHAALQAARSGTSADEDEARAVAARVGRLLFPPELAARVATWRAVCVLGTDLTGWIPFELLKPGENTEELGLSHAVSYLPSLHWGMFLAGRACADTTAAPPDYVLATGANLPESVRARWHVEDFDVGTTDALLSSWGRGARRLDRAALADLRAELPRARVAQFVVHGIYDSGRRRPAGMLLATATNGSHEAWTDDLESIAWPEIVVFTSCGAQRTQLRRGDDGRASLSGAVLAGGARCVVLSYTDIELNASLALSRAFGDGLREGRAPDEALRRARRAPGVGFQGLLVHVTGLTDRPIAPATFASDEPTDRGALGVPSWIAYAAGGGVVLLVIALALRRRA